MSNLSDLLPAGASAKQLTFTDSGSGIASKKPVILNSDGTVAEVSSSTATANVGSITTFNSDAATWCATAAGSGSTNLVAYADSGASSYGTAQVGTISGTGVTFGTKAVFESASVTGIQMAYSSSLDKYLIVYRDNGNSFYGTCVVATVSGTNVTFGTPVAFSARTTYAYAVVYDDAQSVFLIQYSDNNDIFARACTVSGTNASFGAEVTIESTGTSYTCALGYDSTVGKPVGAWRYYTGQQAKAVVYSLSSTTVQINTPVVYASGNGNTGGDAKISYNVKENRIVIAYKEGAGTSGTAIAGEVSSSSITFGTAVQFNASSSGSITCDYDATVTRTIIGYLDAGAAEYPKAIPVTLSGSTITFPDSASTLQSAAAMNLSASYNGTEGKMLFSWIDTSVVGDSVVFTSPGTAVNLTAQAFVGVADSAISASAAGSIIVQGGTVTGVEVDPAVTTGSQAVFDDGGATTRISSAFDPDNNKIVHAFCTTITHAIVGTVSGTSVTYGTAVQINSNASDYTSTAYDTANDRVVIVYSDNGDSYGYASVGTVSGTSITFGTKVVFSTASSNQKSVVYDANAGKVLIVYRDGGGGDEVKGIVGTVDPSDNSISFGSAATAAATQNFNLAAVYDSNAQKTVVVAQDYTDSTGTAYVATITGTSVSFGTGVDFLAAAVNNNALSVTFNSTDNKVIVGYGKASDNKGYLITGTVSGTSIGFAGETAFSSGTTTNYISLAYKAAGNILGIVYNVSGSSKIRFNNAVISGTSFSFGTEQDLVATTTDTTALILDETANNFVASYGDGSNNFDGTTNVVAVSTSAVIGTKYFVTPSGGFSSTAGDPSVNAGLAISTTSLLLNGDS